MLKAVLMLVASLFATLAGAQPLIQQASDITGNWVLESTAPTLIAKRNIENFPWVFKADGTLSRTSLYKFAASITGGGQTGTIDAQYEVKDGKIALSNGDVFEVTEKTAAAMTLKGPFGYYFLKKTP
ncbi:MAG: hypothetical protein ACREWG_07635 [Gammaproteobacteria bacterium]